ncbi:hypothetical protein C5167_036794 [Papaver somniferum]|uniref:Uncharacterized protein n=1 Tax=Papaver somniferum TaxID=3469 RepID=A0A4Y7I8M6_PAPSO|nr:hypothetical protein C5167_036794 [Papaver somniferum]
MGRTNKSYQELAVSTCSVNGHRLWFCVYFSLSRFDVPLFRCIMGISGLTRHADQTVALCLWPMETEDVTVRENWNGFPRFTVIPLKGFQGYNTTYKTFDQLPELVKGIPWETQVSSPSIQPLVVSSLPLEDSPMGGDGILKHAGIDLVVDPVIPPGFEDFPQSGSATPQAAWSSLFAQKKESVISANMEFYSYLVLDGKKSMDIPYEVFDEDIRQCEDKVIGAFVGRRLPFNWFIML